MTDGPEREAPPTSWAVMSRALDQARLDWVTKNLKLAHYVNDLADGGDATAMILQESIYRRGHLTENQASFARFHIRDLRPSADLDESTTVINEDE